MGQKAFKNSYLRSLPGLVTRKVTQGGGQRLGTPRYALTGPAGLNLRPVVECG